MLSGILTIVRAGHITICVYLQCDTFACAMQQQYKRLWPVVLTLLAVQVLVRPQSVE